MSLREKNLYDEMHLHKITEGNFLIVIDELQEVWIHSY